MASPPPAARKDKSTWEKADDKGQVSAQVKAYREQGYAIFEIQVAVAADASAPAARLLQAAVALGQGGQIIAQCPSQDELLNDQHDGRLWLILATWTSADAVEDLLGNVSDLAGFRVQPYATEAPARSPVKDGSASSFESLRVLTSETVRISVERLDNLMNLVGELVTDRTRLVQIEAMLRARYGKGGDIGTLDETLSHLSQITNQLQEEVMRARLLPISQLFDRFPRMVRDVARAADKQVDLVIEGETTELDRSIIEAIGDPLVHLLRNAIDHGIESPQARVSAGKPPTGSVRLTAAHAEGQIVITMQDDGRGIDPEQTRRAAVRHGLISEDEAACLDDEEAIALIFRPGLSTAEQITGVSGRGVGLDVVRTNINQVGGSVVVENQVGHGVTFRVMLPLTLAILPTMLVALGEDVYAIPLTSIVESLYLSDVTMSSVKGNPAIQWRNQVLPLLHLRQFFDCGLRTLALPQRLERRAGASAVDSSSKIQASKSEIQNQKSAIVAVTWGKLQAGLIVDRIIGKQEIVVKPFGSLIGSVPGLSGCTILGNGRIALIVDVPGLINAAMQARDQRMR
jgi:two-component system chemotaxis sensor kinase CheA